MRGLFILYHFLNPTEASAIQNTRFINKLMNESVKIQIITKGDFDIDKSEIYVLKGFPIKILNKILLKIFPDIINLPDIERFFWSRRIRKFCDKTIDFNQFDFVHTTSSPYSVHLVGNYLKKKYKIKWIAQFYDPWVDNNYRNFKCNYLRKLDSKYERIVAENADLIIHSNSIIEQKWIARYGNEIQKKIRILPFSTEEQINSTEIQHHQTKTQKKNYPITIVHAGGLFAERSINPLIEALKILNIELSNLKELIQVNLIGSIAKKEIDLIRNSSVSDCFKIYGQKSFSLVMQEYRDADYLLLVEGLFKENVFFPSKLCEYFSLQKPIIGITPKNGVSYELLKASGHFVISSDDDIRILADYVKIITLKKHTLVYDMEFYKKFLPEKTVELYKAYLSEYGII